MRPLSVATVLVCEFQFREASKIALSREREHNWTFKHSTQYRASSISICICRCMRLVTYNCHLKFYFLYLTEIRRFLIFYFEKWQILAIVVARPKRLYGKWSVCKNRADCLYRFVACCVIVNPAGTIASAIPRLVTLTVHRFTRDTTRNDLLKPASSKLACLRTIAP